MSGLKFVSKEGVPMKKDGKKKVESKAGWVGRYRNWVGEEQRLEGWHESVEDALRVLREKRDGGEVMGDWWVTLEGKEGGGGS